MYYYLDKEKIKKDIVCMLRKSPSRITNIDGIFGPGVAIEYIADSLPPFLIFDEKTNAVRVPTQAEKDQMKFKRLYAGMDLFGGFWTEDNLNPGDFIRREGDTMDGTLAFNHSIPFTIPYAKAPQIWLADGSKANIMYSDGQDVHWSPVTVLNNYFRGNMIIGKKTTMNDQLNMGFGAMDKILMTGTGGNALTMRASDGTTLRFGTSTQVPGGFFFQTSAGYAFRFAKDGIMTSKDQVSTSDERLKNNIIPIRDALEKVMRLRGVNYNWKDTGVYDMGLIAQEVQSVVPEVVHSDENGILSINYAKLTALLIEAIRELVTGGAH